ncbi:MAG: polysaccharide biosynthesis C-terminal domain-containing protein [Bacilli bacterium]|nr:polysaccharide biosynthesis C-terminal domain-containing protein [Bacilli bacterium]
MSEKKLLFNNTIIIFISRIFTQFISFILLPFYTTYLDNGSYGIIDLINTYISLLVPIVTIQLENAVFRYLVDSRNNFDDTKKIISISFKIIIKMILIFILISLILSMFIKINYLYLILLNIILVIFSHLLLQTTRGLGDIKKYSYTSCLIGIITIVLNIVLILFMHMKVEAILISNIVSNFIGCMYLFIKLNLNKYIDFKIKDNKLKKELVSYSIPLIPNNISWWIFTVSDRTIISLFLGVTYNGLYAVSNKFSNLIITLFGIFELAWVESTSKNIKKNNKEEYFSDVINVVLKFTLSLCIVLILVLPLVFDYLINSSFSNSYMYIPILVISSIFSVASSLYSGIYIALKKTKDIMHTSIVAAILNIIINVLFIRFFGLFAASISTLISYIVMFILRYYDLKNYITINYDINILKFIALLIISIFIYYIKRFIFSVVLLVLILFVLYRYLNNDLKTYKNYVLINLTKKFKKI